jgi:hypothetical protein
MWQLSSIYSPRERSLLEMAGDLNQCFVARADIKAQRSFSGVKSDTCRSELVFPGPQGFVLEVRRPEF